ncbi:iron-siderophore ABC transporter substrate-binding protein [Umezawaea sp. Da 62-37]|uniref:iron-siderophore ABC transporter substrate-binding protein n=1 Tax=Umezawaea sp. Da 62-37 TaxID=3075927 RepID=UPI0028F727F7|nr:iron-siderophore ABC transporter substrate-binding protein [Umezawaea sp. Da 62-37]WNV92077.1 iron-siderophore ABC transporter substrate-binding protein [Umezawaea sp. Da 62-37]
MKRAAIGLLTVLLTASLAACGSASTPETGGTSSTAGSAFPVTVDTMFGEVKVEKAPTRVVALGWSDAETALALGVQPVGASDWLAFGGEGVGPWAKGLYEKAPTILGTQELSFEAVAALQPDLILNTRSNLDAKTNETLSKIAPTIAAPKDVIPYGTTWRQQTEMVSKALGKPDKGEELIANVEKEFKDAATFSGKTAVVGTYFGNQYGAYVPGDGRVDFMKELGFGTKKEIDSLAKGTFYVEISTEQLGLLDADLTVVFPIGADASVLRADQVLNNIPSAKAGHLVILDDKALSDAFSSGSTLGVSYAIKNAVPLFTAALRK